MAPCPSSPPWTACLSWHQSGPHLRRACRPKHLHRLQPCRQLQIFHGCRCTALFKLGLSLKSTVTDLFGRGFDRNGTIGNAGDRANDMLFFSMSKPHERKCEQESNDRDRAFHNFFSVIVVRWWLACLIARLAFVQELLSSSSSCFSPDPWG